MSNNSINMNRLITTGRVVGVPNKQTVDSKSSSQSTNFKEILQETVKGQEIKFSKHAAERMLKRNIRLSPGELQKIKDAVLKANDKGVRDSLILLNQTVFIVNIPSKTVVTAVSEENMKEHIFTNIDGAVIL